MTEKDGDRQIGPLRIDLPEHRFFQNPEKPLVETPEKQNQLQNPRPRASETPLQRMNMGAIACEPSIVPGKLMVLVRAAGSASWGSPDGRRGYPPRSCPIP